MDLRHKVVVISSSSSNIFSMERLYILNPTRCSGCGMINALKGAVYECGLRIDRQLNAFRWRVFLEP
ncbi:MAG: hypothetical protein QXH90_07595 [Candidatus Korarchaeum sp.]